MSTAVHPLPPLAIDQRRGTIGMSLFIVTEASLFVMLFFAYFYLGSRQPFWPPDPPPSLLYPLIMLALLLTSSAVLYAGERAAKRGRAGRARAAIVLTVLLGAGFLGIQAQEYAEKLTHLRPTTNAYGSIFYTMTGFHACHVVLGLLMLIYVLILPHLESDRPPHRPLHNAALYWHFVDAVWVLIVAVLYVLPHFTRFAG
jgi:heme/copper-type cytochrome/quinol oxidase subunit 3